MSSTKKKCCKKQFDLVKQQRLGGLICIPEPKTLIIIFMLTGVPLILIGCIFYVDTRNLKQFTQQYTSSCKQGNGSCTIKLNITENYETNPKIYLKFDNFYSNHRQYVKSRSYKQLRGNSVNQSQVSATCSETTLNKDIKQQGLSNTQGTALDPDAIANPCGNIAKFYPTDKLTLFKKDGTAVQLNQSNIAHSFDKNFRFKNGDLSKQHLDVEQEHLMVWYQMQTFSSFIKLYAHIQDGRLEKGEYQLKIQNYSESLDSSGVKKSIHISEIGNFGGPNLAFVGICIGGGGFVFIMAILLIILSCVDSSLQKKRKRKKHFQNLGRKS